MLRKRIVLRSRNGEHSILEPNERSVSMREGSAVSSVGWLPRKIIIKN